VTVTVEEQEHRTHRIFISHAEADKGIAMALKRLIGSLFHEQIDTFVSSDEESIRLGEQWFEIITSALHQADSILVLCSPESVRRPWVNFEFGGAYFLGKSVIPICIKEMRLEDLPSPYNRFQGFTGSDYPRLIHLLGEIAQRIGFQISTIDIENTDYHFVVHGLPSKLGEGYFTISGGGVYNSGLPLHFSGTVTDGSRVLTIKIMDAPSPYRSIREVNVAVQNDQTFEITISTSEFSPGQYFVLAETQRGSTVKLTFLILKPMRQA